MAYFANGTDGAIFREEYCLNCVHWQNVRDDDGREIEETWGCPVYDLHLMHSYDICNADDVEKFRQRVGTKEARSLGYGGSAPLGY